MKSMVFFLAALFSLSAAEDVVTLPLKVDAYVDAGQVVKGLRADPGNDSKTLPVGNYFLSNTGISILSQTVVKEKLHLNIGVGGLFWYPFTFPSTVNSRQIKFGPGISEASFRYDFSENLFVKSGFFDYKYNPDARNLGEYLLRSQAYPGFVKTGGWSIINSAAYQSLGTQIRWNTFGGAWTHDLLLFSEFEETPLFDMSPAYVSTLRMGTVLELGAGVSFHRLLAIKPSEDSPNYSTNTYVEVPNMAALPEIDTVIGGQVFRQHAIAAGSTYKGMESTLTKYRNDSGSVVKLANDAQGNRIYVLDQDTMRAGTRTRLTYRGVKLMGRASLDFKPWFGLEDKLEPGDLKLYGEVAVLGVQNQPYYYDKLAYRMPIMFGFGFPTFKWLDALSMEAEYYRNPWPDNRENAFQNSLPLWFVDNGLSPGEFDAEVARNHNSDDWKWSIYASKTLTKGIRLLAQVANDHLRLRNEFLQPTYIPLTSGANNWYYLVRLQFGI